VLPDPTPLVGSDWPPAPGLPLAGSDEGPGSRRGGPGLQHLPDPERRPPAAGGGLRGRQPPAPRPHQPRPRRRHPLRRRRSVGTPASPGLSGRGPRSQPGPLGGEGGSLGEGVSPWIPVRFPGGVGVPSIPGGSLRERTLTPARTPRRGGRVPWGGGVPLDPSGDPWGGPLDPSEVPWRGPLDPSGYPWGGGGPHIPGGSLGGVPGWGGAVGGALGTPVGRGPRAAALNGPCGTSLSPARPLPAPHPLSPVLHPSSLIPCMSHVPPCPLSHVPCPLSPACPLSFIPHPSSLVPHPLPLSPACPMSPLISCPSSLVPCLSHVPPCPLPVPCTLSFIP